VPGLRAPVRFLLAAALVVAQQSALAHQIWHFASAPERSAQQLDARASVPDAGGGALCAMHALLGDVLAALDTARAAAACAAPPADAIACAVSTPASPACIAPSSRGPPSLL
jgi:hypothetical protein